MWNLIAGDVAVAVLFVAVTGEIGVNGESKVTSAIVAVLVVAAAGESILAPVATAIVLVTGKFVGTCNKSGFKSSCKVSIDGKESSMGSD